jgi:uncharacterized protein (DUF4415 family)
MSDLTIPNAGSRTIEEMEREAAAIQDADIDLSDVPETTAEQRAMAERGTYYRPVKDQVTLRIDRYVLEWFRQNHPRYQTAINAALLEHIRRERTMKNTPAGRQSES